MIPDCDFCGRYESGLRVIVDLQGMEANICPCCHDYGGHSEDCDCN